MISLMQHIHIGNLLVDRSYRTETCDLGPAIKI